ncbi:hypothetical protein L202_07209 [Cryptococcus amylolentus CBS 6039]|uniref:Uncharacterized protein n=1 Tax=Cryptococcus amylolentus CBS 6039 TaxID=1295533 RepID=A0A1E3HBF0_9TREE|nr:hypothetical protein L202_07209 [Cryptococcus amylolentus CBS 6039]ODN73662.1 hypothetical protein L202_07209 [Cryptococcus amylolentus CBS 6039]
MVLYTFAQKRRNHVLLATLPLLFVAPSPLSKHRPFRFAFAASLSCYITPQEHYTPTVMERLDMYHNQSTLFSLRRRGQRCHNIHNFRRDPSSQRVACLHHSR